MTQKRNFLVVNHSTYRRGLTSKGNIACTKRSNERVSIEIKIHMDKIMNLYKSAAGSEIPLELRPQEQGVINYVVLNTQSQPKLPANSIRLTDESPKCITRRVWMELGISRNMKMLGRRRIHSTAFIGGKESSVNLDKKTWFEGQDFSYLIHELENDLNILGYCKNLTTIMSNKSFLIGCWARIKSKPGNMTPSLDSDTLDGLNESWFDQVSNQFRNGLFKFKPSRRTYISKPNGKLRPFTMPSPKDKIVQEGMRFLLEIIFDREFLNCSHGFRPQKGCHTCLKDIRYKFSKCNWFIKGDVTQQFPSINHNLLIQLIRRKIKDEPFIDLIYKYLRVGYGEDNSTVVPMNVGLIQGGLLSPLFSNIVMHEFDKWMTEITLPKYNKGEVKSKRKNPEYLKRRYKNLSTHGIRSTPAKDSNYSRMYYVRYADDFLIGVNGSKEICQKVKLEMKDFLRTLNLELNLEKTHITHAVSSKAKFLGYEIGCTPPSKMPRGYNSKGILTVKTTNAILLAPIRKIVEKLVARGFAKKGGVPTRNGRYINFELPDIVKHYLAIERGIINYYSLANNYGRLTARVHYILKYSCALTICSKMKLKSLRRTFSKYGRNLNVVEGEKVISYPTR